MEPEVRRVLERTRELVVAGWCQGSFARTAAGEAVGYNNEEAERWCLSGAVNRAACDVGGLWAGAEGAYTVLQGALGEEVFLSWWNDQPGRGRSEVLALIDRVLAEGSA